MRIFLAPSVLASTLFVQAVASTADNLTLDKLPAGTQLVMDFTKRPMKIPAQAKKLSFECKTATVYFHFTAAESPRLLDQVLVVTTQEALVSHRYYNYYVFVNPSKTPSADENPVHFSSESIAKITLARPLHDPLILVGELKSLLKNCFDGRLM